MIKLRSCFCSKYLIEAFCFILLCNSWGEAQSINKKEFEFKEIDSSLILYWKFAEIEKCLYKFNDIPQYEKRIFIFSNGNILGFFPNYDSSLQIKRWNDLGHKFSLFYADLDAGVINILRTGIGWQFHVNEISQLDVKMVSTTSVGESEVLFMNNKGGIDNHFKLKTKFNPDFIKITNLTATEAVLSFEILGERALYHLDFNTNSARLVHEELTEQGK